MKIAETKPAGDSAAKNREPFFNKAGGSMFSNKAANEQSSFFTPQRNSFFKHANRAIQTKLTIGQPNDKYEQEADAMADKVVQHLSKPQTQVAITPLNVQTKCAACDQKEQVQQKEEVEEKELPKEKLQKKPVFESNAEPPDDDKNIQRKCVECEKEEKLQKKIGRKEEKKDVGKLQKKAIFESNEKHQKDSIQPKCTKCEKEDGKKIQAKPEANSSQPASSSIESSLNASKGLGNPLPTATRDQMENSFGADFSNVRIHNDSWAVQMSKDLNAQAFTHGSDIYFNSGKYDTNSDAGRYLLAHELTHTMQQNNGMVAKTPDLMSPALPPLTMPVPEMPMPSAWSQNIYPPLQEVYFARKGVNLIAIPRTDTSVQQLAEFLFNISDAAGEIQDDALAKASSLETIAQGIRDMNEIIADSILGKQHVMIGDLATRFTLKRNVIYLLQFAPVFPADIQDPEYEFNRMGITSAAEFIKRKADLDAAANTDIVLLSAQVKRLVDDSFWDSMFERLERHMDCETKIMAILRKWAYEPLAKNQIYISSKKSEYFDKILLGLGGLNTVIKNILVDERAALDDILFNHITYNKDELDFLKKTASLMYNSYVPVRELSLWDDFAKPALIRIPGAITEEIACFVKVLPGDLAKDIGEELHGISSDYLDATLPEDKEGNQLTQEIACTAGEIVFDLAGALAKVKKVIDAINDADELYKTYNEVVSVIGDLPESLEIFTDIEKLLGVLFALDNNTVLDNLEQWVIKEDQQAATEPVQKDKSAPKSSIAKFRQLISELISIIKKILRPIFEIRRKFRVFIEQIQDVLLSHPLLQKALIALRAGQKIAKLAKNYVGQDAMAALVSVLTDIKTSAAEFINSIGDKIMDVINKFKDRIASTITDFALTEISNIGGTVKATLSIPPVKDRINNLISKKITGPFIEKAGLEVIIQKISAVIKIITSEVISAVDNVIDGFGGYMRESLQDFNLQLKSVNNTVPGTQPSSQTASMIAESGGHQMPDESARMMEGAFREDFRKVSIHDDLPAQHATEQLSAKAFTKSNDIYFNKGQYNPHSDDGKKLLAHELTHVVQQNQGGTPYTVQRAPKDSRDRFFSLIYDRVMTTAQIREMSGIAKGGEHLPVIKGKWLPDGRMGLFPGQIARVMRGEKFKNFKEFRMKFWRLVAADSDGLGKAGPEGWSASNIALMKKGYAPKVGTYTDPKTKKKVYQGTGGGSNTVYQLNHILALDRGGELYDMDNLEIVTPVMHLGVDPRKEET
jgi:hypothetical protein